jgi:hypothetical protein
LLQTTQSEAERRRRIQLSVAAYAYEYYDHSIMSDAEFDSLALEVDVDIKTGNRKLDSFFKKHFQPDTGLWIRFHPDRKGLENIYHRIWKDRK